MKNVKYTLLVLHLCTALLDVTFSALLIPILKIPAMMGYTLGFLSYPLGIPVVYQFYFISIVIPWLGASISGAFENRYYQLVRKSDGGVFHSKFRTVVNIINYIWPFFHYLPVFLTSPDLDDGVQYYKKLYPLLDPTCYLHDNLYIISKDWRAPLFIALFTLCLYALQVAFYFLAILHYFYSNRHVVVSANTLAIQRKFFYAIFLQIFVPFVMIWAPTVYFLVAYVANLAIDVINWLSMFCIASHGIVATFVMIRVHAPYRRATLEILYRKPLRHVENKISFVSTMLS